MYSKLLISTLKCNVDKNKCRPRFWTNLGKRRGNLGRLKSV